MRASDNRSHLGSGTGLPLSRVTATSTPVSNGNVHSCAGMMKPVRGKNNCQCRQRTLISRTWPLWGAPRGCPLIMCHRGNNMPCTVPTMTGKPFDRHDIKIIINANMHQLMIITAIGKKNKTMRITPKGKETTQKKKKKTRGHSNYINLPRRSLNSIPMHWEPPVLRVLGGRGGSMGSATHGIPWGGWAIHPPV